MNKVTTKKYTDMKQMAIDLENGMKELNEKCENVCLYAQKQNCTTIKQLRKFTSFDFVWILQYLYWIKEVFYNEFNW